MAIRHVALLSALPPPVSDARTTDVCKSATSGGHRRNREGRRRAARPDLCY